MTLLEYVASLQDQGLSSEEVFAKAQEWKKKNQPKQVEVETIKTPNQEQEQLKLADVAEPKDATVASTETPEASENLESGSGQLQFTPTIDEDSTAEYNLDLINQRIDRAISMDADRALKSSKIVFQDDYVDFDPYGTGEAGKIDLEQRKSSLGIVEAKPESEDDILIRQFKEATDLQKPQYDSLYSEIFDNENLFNPVEKQKIVKGAVLSGMDVKAAMMTPSLQETIVITPYEDQLKKAEKQLNELRKIGEPKASREDIEYRAKQNIFNEKARDIKMNNARAFIENIPEEERTEAQKLIASSIVEKRNRATWEVEDFAKELELDLNKFKDSSLIKNFENYTKSIKSKQEQIKSVQDKIKNKQKKGQNITQDLIEYRDLANNYKDFIEYYNIQGSNLKNEQLDLENRMAEYNNMISVIEDSDVQLDALKRNYDKFEKRFTDLKLGALSIGLNTAALLEKASNFMSATTLETDDKGNVIGVSKPSTFFQDEAKKLVEVKEFVANKYYKPVSFKNAFSSLSNFGEYAIDQAINQAPIFAAIASGNLGMLAVSASSGGEYQAQRQLEAEKKGGRAYNEFNVFLQSLGFGAAEYAFGVAPTSLILKGTLRGASETGKRQILDGWKNFFRNARLNASQDVGEVVLDAGGEGLTTIFQNGIDGRPLFENVAESIFSGGMFASTFKGASFFKGAAAAALSDYNTTSDYRANLRMLETIERAINSPFTNKNDIEGLNKQKQDLLNTNKEILENRVNLTTNNLNKQGAYLLEQSMKRQEELRVQAEALDNNNSIPAEQKKSMLKSLEFEFNTIQDGINNFKKAFTNTFTLLSRSEQGRLKTEATRLLQVDGIQEPSGTQIARKAEQLHVKEKLEQTLKSDKSTLKAMSGAGIDVQYKVSDTNKQAIKDFTKMMNARAADSNNSITEEQAQKYIEDFTEKVNSGKTNGINIPSTNTKTGKTVYDSVTTVQNSIANERSQTSLHELGHVILTEALGVNSNAFKQSSKLILSYLKESNPEAYTRISTRTKGQGADEVLTVFFEEVADGKIKLDKARNDGFLGYLGTLLNMGTSKASNTNYNYNFKGETDIINFAKELGRKLKDGTLTVGDVKTIQQEGLAGKKLIELDEVIVTGRAASTEAKLSQEASNEVQKIYDEQGVAGAMDIIQKFKPITSRIVESRSQAPNFDRQLLTDEIETGERGILDLIMSYPKYVKKQQQNREKVAPLAGFINNMLPKRAIEASRRVLGEEFTTDVTEAKGVVAEEVAETITEEKPIAKKPTETVEFSQAQIEKVGAKDKSEVETKITKATKDSFEGKKITRFGETRNVPKAVADIYAGMFGLNPQTITDKTRNYQKTDAEGLTTAKQFLLKNANNDFARLPETKDGFGKGTFLPRNVMNALYTDGKLTGTLKDYMDLIRQKPTKPIYRDAVGQTIRGLLNLHIRNRMFEDLVAATPERLRGGAKFSEEITNIFQKTNKESESIGLNAYEINYNNTLNQILKDTGVDRINMQTPEGRKRFLQFAVDSGLTKKTPPSFWIGMAYVTESAFTAKQKREFKKEGVVGKPFTIDGTSLREYTGNLPFKNTVEARQWIASIGKQNFAKETDAFKNMLKQEDVFTKKGDLSVALNNSEFIKRQDDSINELKKLFELFQNEVMRNSDGTMNFEGVAFVGALLSSSSAGRGHFLRKAAPFRFYQKGYLEAGSGATTLEHTMPATLVGKYLFMQALNGSVETNFKYIKDNYFQGALLKVDDNKLKGKKPDGSPFNYVSTMPEGFQETDTVWARYFNINVANTRGGINPKSIILADNKSVFDLFSITPSGLKLNEQGVKDVPVVEKTNASVEPSSLKLSEEASTQQHIYIQGVLDDALNMARRPNAPVKKIRVFDFDDTLAKSKSMVIVNMPDGSSKKINATEFASEAIDLEAQGATFDFTEFSKVIDGKKGPLFSVAEKIAAARGTDDIFILTARPQDAAGPIQEFMKANGIDIPLANITGLGDGTAAAKGRWIAGKAAEGYNDFYFADDAVKNVQAVKEVLSQVDVKSKVQQAKLSKEQAFDKIFNDIIEAKTGIESYKQYSAAKAKTVGSSKGKFTFFTTPSAEDFVGLLYKTLGKGKVGDAQMAFYKTNLIDPYNRAEMAISQAKVAAGRDYKELKKQFKNIPKTLEKETGIAKYTYQHAIRTYIWDSQGLEVPGLSKRDQKRLTDFIKADPELQAFADQLVNIQKGKPYPKPDKDWTAGNITTDVISGINKVNRVEYLKEWQENVDIIFSEKNMNKLEAAFGAKYVEALKDSLRAMKSGSNRPLGGDRVSNGILDWLNNSVGSIMFLNTRSAVLQTISAVNFINWGDNNILKAGKAFANQKQFWSDFLTLMNSDYLLERRDGLKINVSESEIADAVEGSKNKVNAAISYLLNKGFVFTRYADSFAIASGGATFYRNRIESLVEQGMDRKAAEQQAFEDFRLIAEENQQSSSPMRISQQQRSLIGRIILQFGNTQLQYVRIQKRAVQDLVNGRGDWKSNISKIVYYGAIQNIMFNALQSGLAWALFDDDEDDEKLTEANKEQKLERALNGAIDSQLKGLGIQGAVIAGVKNALMTIAEEAGKKSPKFEEALDDLLSIAPALGSKIRKIKSAARTVSWNRKEIKEKGFSMDNPAYLAGAQTISAVFNIPLDRAVMKMNNMRNILNPATENWQKVALALGWSGWDVGLPYFGLAEDKPVLTETEKQTKKLFDLNKSDQVKMLLDLGLTKKQIRALTKEEQRVKEIIKLQNKKKDGK